MELKNICLKPDIITIPGTEVWRNIGVFPTPINLVNSFIEFICNSVEFEIKSKYLILDIFAGDGRLGLMFSNKLEALNVDHEITFVEIKENTIPSSLLKSNHILLNQNAFSFQNKVSFNFIISNPPYLILNVSKATQLGFSWAEAKRNSRNLYGLSIKRFLELCNPGGHIAIIAPFGYLRGINSSELRHVIDKECDRVLIRASSERNLFKGVNQDIAFQLFRKRINESNKKTKWKFAYNGDAFKVIHIALPPTNNNLDRYVRVGPIVWNRKKKFLSGKKDNNICLIYGGNITKKGRLNLEIKRYQNKQYIIPKGTVPTDLLSTPFIALRRTVRGKPGLWEIDSVLINDQENNYTAENHVITIELPELPNDILLEIQNELVNKIYDHHFHSGSPNISTKIVSKLFSSIINYYLEY